MAKKTAIAGAKLGRRQFLKGAVVTAGAAAASGAGALPPRAWAAGSWQAEQFVDNALGGFPNQMALARFTSNGQDTLAVAYNVRIPILGVNIVMRLSTDGGVTWGPRITVDIGAGDQFDPDLAVDAGQGRLYLLFSRNAIYGGRPANDLVITFSPLNSPTLFVVPICVRCDGEDNWDSKIQYLPQFGSMLVAMNQNGPETGKPAINYSLFSNTPPAFWTSPVRVYSGPGNQYTPNVVRFESGYYLYVFSDVPDDGSSNSIKAVGSWDFWSWSSPWIVDNSLPGIASTQLEVLPGDGAWPNGVAALMEEAFAGGTWGVYTRKTTNSGQTWSSPVRVNATAGCVEGQFIRGSRGWVFFYEDAAGNNLFCRRYEGGDPWA